MDASVNRQPFNQPLTFRALRKLALSLGWKEEKNQGKGSHRAFVRKGYREVTLPCHGEAHEYSRGMTRKFLKQLLEPLIDVCPGEVNGVYQVEQVERILAERLEYLPSQMAGEYDRAIAEMKAAVSEYQIEEKLKVDDKLKAYEEQKFSEFEQTIASLQHEQAHPAEHLSVMLAGCLIHKQQAYKALLARQKSLGEDFAEQHVCLTRANEQQQVLQTQLETMQDQMDDRRAEDQKNYQEHQALIQNFQRHRKRDRLIIFGLAALSMALLAILVHQSLPESRPQTAPQASLSSIS